MKTKTQLKAECFDEFITAAKSESISIKDELGRSMVSTAMTLNAMLAAKIANNNKPDMRSKHDAI